jgi:NMD protein affecting ribosome stability and mRNA decay
MVEAASVVCGSCGRTEDEPPLSWSREVTARGIRWLCETCTREHVHDIETKLDDRWW